MDDSFCLKRVRLSGYDAAVRVFPAESPIAPTIIALHGFSGSGLDFLPLREAMGAESWHWICPDFMGHGLSSSPSELDPYSLVNSLLLVDFARNCAPDGSKVYLLGYSMGGRIALHYVNVASPISTALIGASPGIENLEEREARKTQDRLLVDLLSKDGMEAFSRFWEAQPIIAPQTRLPEPLSSELADRRRSNKAHGLGNALLASGSGSMPSLWNRLGSFSSLTCLYGENDVKFRDITNEMIHGNQDIGGYVVPGCGHSPHLEAPGKVATFLKTLFSR